MKKNLLILLSLVALGGSISAMEDNQNLGETAIKNHPKAWFATKVAGGLAGMYGGLLGFSAHLDSGFYKHEPLPIRLLEGTFSPKSRLGKLTNLFMLAPIIYGSWKGGEAVSKAAWHPAWNGIDKIQKFKNSIKK